jgi:putative membrane protein
MKSTIQGFLLAGTLVLGGAALAQQGAQGMGQEQGKGKGAAAKGGIAEHRGFMVPTDEKAFFERLHYTHQMEIKQGQLAQQNASNPDVKSFAEMMVRDHTAADQRLMTLAQGRGMKLADMPKPVNDMEKKMVAADKANMEKLQALKGDAFDSCYMAIQVGEHDATLGKLMAGRQAFSANTELTTMVTELTPKVAQHRQQAYSVLGKLGQTMGVGGAGTDTMGGQKGGQMGGQGQGQMGGQGQGQMGGQQGSGSGQQKQQ